MTNTPTPDQRNAYDRIISVLADPTSNDRQIVLGGYAGTGKTWLTGKVAKALHKSGRAIAAIAPTHRALGALRAALPIVEAKDAQAPPIECMTIHSALGWRVDPVRGRHLKTGRHKLAGYDILLIEEASMITDEMYDELQDIIWRPASTLRALWVGDPAQLPPVSDSDELSPVFSRVREQIRLTHIVRQAEGSPIIQASMYVRECLERSQTPDVDELMHRVASDAVTVQPGGAANIAETTVSAIRAGLDVIAIAWTNKAIEKVGALVTRNMHPPGSARLVAGDPVLWGRGLYPVANTDERSIVVSVTQAGLRGPLDTPCLEVVLRGENGATNTVMTPCDLDTINREMRTLAKARSAAWKNISKARDARDSQAVTHWEFERDKHGMAYAECESAYADIRTIYASTAHKAQGSTYQAAIIDWRDMLTNSNTDMLCRLLYVAITRPTDYLVLCT